MRSIASHLRYLAEASGTRVPNPLEPLDDELARAVALFAGEEKSQEEQALALLRRIASNGQQRLEELSEAITRAYFSHVPAAQAVGSMATMAAS
jgi:hypothetical protein